MMLTPWGPSAVPTGGAGVACPAGTCSFTTAVIGFAIVSPSLASARSGLPRNPWSVCLELQVIELHRSGPPEQRYRNAHLPLVRQHFFHRAAEVRERSLGDLHHLAHQERNLLGGLLFLHRFLDAEEPVDLVGTQRHRQPPGAHELNHALDAVDDVDRFLVQDHLHEHVPGIDLALHRHLLAVLDLHHVLGGDQRLPDRLLDALARIFRDAARDERPHLVLVARGRLNRVPAMLRHQNSFATAFTNTRVAFLSSSSVGQVTLRTSARTSRKKSTICASRPRGDSPVASASVATTSIPCVAAACCSAGRTSSTRPARGASAGSSS